MNRTEVPYAGIRARMAAAGIENAEILGTYDHRDHRDHRGEADWRLTLWRLWHVGDTRAAETNADPVFESDNPEAFAELLAEYGIRSVTIDRAHYDLVARDEAGNVLARRGTNCNPAALAQLVLDCEQLGVPIDWPRSQVGKPARD